MIIPLSRRSVLALLGSACGPSALAQITGQRPVLIQHGFAAGGPAELITRIVGQQIETLGAPVVVESKAGAGGNIAASGVARAAADGNTLLVGAVNQAIAPALFANPGYDQERDLTTVTLVAYTPNVVVVPPSSPIQTIGDLIARAKNDPGGVTFGSSGIGTTLHLAGEVFNSMAGVRLTHVPYKGATPAEVDLMAGRTSLMFTSIVSAAPLVAAGRLRAIAVTSKTRSRLLPSIPTVAESGLPGFEVAPWYALWAPSKTPADIVARLNAAVTSGIKRPEVQDRMINLGIEPLGMSSAESQQYVRSEIQKWGTLVRSLNIKPE